ncbi:MAG: family 16 glycosylhydrolase [Bacteroidia bacterium]|nr:family 16 glycosylhydrolase [Bacteroidia bacterium]
MKKIFIIFLVLLNFLIKAQRSITESPDAGAPPNYLFAPNLTPVCNDMSDDLYLAWSDEFNSSSLDQNRWKLGWHWGVTYGLGSCWADPSQIHFTGNSIKLGVNYNPNYVPGDNNTTVYCKYGVGAISTEEDFGYGYYEVRCKIPYISKHHPAFWLYGGCKQEIDVFEFTGIANKPIQSTNSPPWADQLGVCIPHRNYWYMPKECAAATPIMTYHSPDINGCNFPVSYGRRELGRTLNYQTWDVDPTPWDPSVGCVYEQEVDVDFHNDWHTFGMKFSPEGIFWYIDGTCVVAEYRFFVATTVWIPELQEYTVIYYPIMNLKNFCQIYSGTTVYEQVNLPTDKIKMSIILENYRDPDAWFNGYNLFDFINNWTNWPDGFLEVDYIRCYQFSQCNKDLNFCNNNQLKLYNNSIKARNITFNNGCSLNSPTQFPYSLNLKALEEVKIQSEFGTNLNSEFSAEISSCNNGQIMRSSNTTKIDSLEIIKHYNPKLFEKKTKIVEENILNPYVNFIIFPSPSKGEFTVKTDNIYEKTLNIISNLGATVYTTKFSTEQIELNLNLNSGIYFVEIIVDGVKQQKKLIIQ